MLRDLGDFRKTYQKDTLLEANIPRNPFELFDNWFREIELLDQENEVNTMAISTIGSDGFPKTRIVLLKELNNEGFIFYTNYNSEKGRALAENNKIGALFFWQKVERQVIIKGIVEKISPEKSDNYFASRPRGSQLGAVVSKQSEIIESRDFLEQKMTDSAKIFESKPIERPENWGGYIIKPISFEFWQGRENRLHDRILFSKTVDLNWKIDRLSP